MSDWTTQQIAEMCNPTDSKEIERRVMRDINRPCLFGVAGPCFHPKCLDAHYETVRRNMETP